MYLPYKFILLFVLKGSSWEVQDLFFFLKQLEFQNVLVKRASKGASSAYTTFLHTVGEWWTFYLLNTYILETSLLIAFWQYCCQGNSVFLSVMLFVIWFAVIGGVWLPHLSVLEGYSLSFNLTFMMMNKRACSSSIQNWHFFISNFTCRLSCNLIRLHCCV